MKIIIMISITIIACVCWLWWSSSSPVLDDGDDYWQWSIVVIHITHVMLPAIWFLLLASCYFPFGTCYLLIANYFLLFATCYWLLNTCYLLFSSFYLLLDTSHLVLATCFLLITSCYLILAICYFAFATCYMLLATCYLPFAICRPNQLVEITLHEVDVDCTDGLVMVRDVYHHHLTFDIWYLTFDDLVMVLGCIFSSFDMKFQGCRIIPHSVNYIIHKSHIKMT